MTSLEPWRAAALLLGLAGLGLPRAALADCADGRPRTIGHRGTGTSSLDNPYPENTLPAILAAAEEGASMAEIDVQLTADGIPVLMHDARVDGTTDGMGCVSALTLAELQALDAGVGTPMEGTGVQVPTLEQVLSGSPLDLNVELKASGAGCPSVSDAEFAAAVLDVLDADPTPRALLISSFDLALLEEVRAQDPDVSIGQLSLTPDSTMATADAGFDALVLIDGSVDDAAVATAADAGLQLVVWTVDAPARLAELFALDVDGIITNEPSTMEQVRAEVCPSEDDTTGTTGETSEGDDTGLDPSSTDPTNDSTGATDQAPPEGEPTEGSGCTCHAAPSPNESRDLALLMGLGLVRRRRATARSRAPAPRETRLRSPAHEPRGGRGRLRAP
ncbi:MAG: hypothetical protein KDK70_23855 [Myxococcales bacterium]|nr:hypothetical protein [Myxococcales bacterium]